MKNSKYLRDYIFFWLITIPILGAQIPPGGYGGGPQAYGPQTATYPLPPYAPGPGGNVYEQISADPELSIFKKAIDSEGLYREFSDPNIQLTVLAPTDMALVLASRLDQSFRLDSYTLRGHFVKGLLTPDILISNPNKSYETLGYGKVWNSVGTSFDKMATFGRSQNEFQNPYGGHQFYPGSSAGNYEFYMNSAKIAHFGTKQGNALLHKIDRVLFPLGRSLTVRKFIHETPDLSTLNSLGINEIILRSLDREQEQFTVFLPSNRAFQKIPTMDRNLFSRLFQAHIIPNQVLFTRVLGFGNRYTTGLGQVQGQLKLYAQTRGYGNVPLLPWQNSFVWGCDPRMAGSSQCQPNPSFNSGTYRGLNTQSRLGYISGVPQPPISGGPRNYIPPSYADQSASSNSYSSPNNRYSFQQGSIGQGNNYRTGANAEYGIPPSQYQGDNSQTYIPASVPRRYRSMTTTKDGSQGKDQTTLATNLQGTSTHDGLGKRNKRQVPINNAPYGFISSEDQQRREEELRRLNPQLSEENIRRMSINTNPFNSGPHHSQSHIPGSNLNHYRAGVGSQYGPINSGGLESLPLEYQIVSESTSRFDQILDGSVYAKIDVADIPLSNGVVHIIDNILAFIFQPMSLYLQTQRNLSEFNRLLRESPDTLRYLVESGRDLTIFAPTDEAFRKIPPQIFRDRFQGNPQALQQLLKLHMVENQKILTTDLTNETEIPTLQDGQRLRFTVYNQLSGYTFVKGGGVMAYIIEPNVGVTNGIVHIIDSVLGLPFLDAFSYIQNSPQLTHLYSMILDSYASNDFSQTDNRYTYFLPSAEAFAQLANQYPDKIHILQSHPTKMRYLLRNHILDYAVPLNDRATEQNYDNINRNKVKLNLNPWTNERTITYGTAQAKILQSDIETTNGYINIIDTVLFIPVDIQNSANLLCHKSVLILSITLIVNILNFRR